MTTDTQLTPTDAEIVALIDKEMREYSDGAYADHGSARSQLEHFARAVLAKLGTPPAVAGEPVAEVDEWFGRPVILYGAPMLKHKQKLYTTPQAGTVPMTQDQALVAAGHVSQELVDKAMALPGAPQPAHSGKSFQTYGETRAYSKGYYAGKKAALASQPAHSGEPCADSLRHQNKLLAESLGACILASGIVRKDIDGFTGPQLLHFAEDLRSMLEKAPQPVEREPLPVSQIRDWWASENGLEDCEMCKLTDFLRVVRAVEEKHGIKGGQHG